VPPVKDALTELPEQLRSTPLAHRHAARWVSIGVGVLAALAVAGFLATGGAQPKDPYLASSRVPGFDEATLTVKTVVAGSTVAAGDHCSLFATTPQQVSTGMMRKKDFAGYASMVFRFQADTNTLFYNRAVPIPLTVAWFAADGRFVGAKDLEPCPDVEGCPTIASPEAFRYAVEVGKGHLGDLGLGAGSIISVAPGCS
jgi:uncharacterized membrane protein (UPF0127 family)